MCASAERCRFQPPTAFDHDGAPVGEQVVNNLVRKDAERARALRHYESTRIYHLSYRGFPGDRDAEMTVEATYDSPSTKKFKIISQKGSKLIIDRVFKRLLESEKEAAEPEMHARTLLNRENYDIALVGYRKSGPIRADNMCLRSIRRQEQVCLSRQSVGRRHRFRGDAD